MLFFGFDVIAIHYVFHRFCVCFRTFVNTVPRTFRTANMAVSFYFIFFACMCAKTCFLSPPGMLLLFFRLFLLWLCYQVPHFYFLADTMYLIVMRLTCKANTLFRLAYLPRHGSLRVCLVSSRYTKSKTWWAKSLSVKAVAPKVYGVRMTDGFRVLAGWVSLNELNISHVCCTCHKWKVSKA